MKKPTIRDLLYLLAILLITGLLAAACSFDASPRFTELAGPPVPSGATIIPGGPMESTPAAPSPRVPTSQQEAENTVVHYLQKTIDALPPGANVDGSRYHVGSGIRYCEDEPKDENAPISFAYWGDLNLPPGTDTKVMINQIGDIWKGWGWQVLEREGFEKPNRFGYAPDGYVLQVEVAYPPTYPPTIIGSSPCFPGSLRQEGLPFLKEIQQTSPTK
jgi:hypothetical protein